MATNAHNHLTQETHDATLSALSENNYLNLHALFLCVHVCRRRRRLLQHPATDAADAAVVISQLPAHECVIVYYTNHNMVPCSTTTKSLSLVGEGLEKKECCICLSHFKDNEKLKWLTECEHVYHSECLDMWLGANCSCPLCRSSLHVSDDPLKKSIISS
ncbi:hypothetical protein Lal_00021404 [Lupinus albus]|nr:hypothetical protein Lal_00021404 [Lupinus albus]